MIRPKIRIDDVLQSERFSSSQLEAFKVRSPFEWFRLAVDGWDDYPLVLAVVAEGIDKYPSWVRFIKDHPKWKVQCHGWDHRDYRKVGVEEGVRLLINARKKIEDTFGVIIHEFYPPWMKHSPATETMADVAGLRQVIEETTSGKWLLDNTAPNLYFHYWSQNNLDQIHNICRLLRVNS